MYKCIRCKKQFSRTLGEINRGRTKFCSRLCSDQYKKDVAIITANKVLKAGKKQCHLCHRTRKLQYFPKSKIAVSGYYSYCYDCKRSINRLQDERRHESRKLSQKNAYLLRTYGITLDTYNRMLEAQNHQCAICRRDNDDIRKFAVDHDHLTGKVRALLCHNCNKGLGMFQDNADLLQKASKYLENWY